MAEKLSASENIAVELFAGNLRGINKPFIPSTVELHDDLSDALLIAKEVVACEAGTLSTANCSSDSCQAKISNSEGIHSSVHTVMCSMKPITVTVSGASDSSDCNAIIERDYERGHLRFGSNYLHRKLHQGSLQEVSEFGSITEDGRVSNCSSFCSLRHGIDMVRSEKIVSEGHDIFEIESDLELYDDAFDDALNSRVLSERTFRKQTDSMNVETSRRNTLASFSGCLEYDQEPHYRAMSYSLEHLAGEDIVSPTNVLLEFNSRRHVSQEVRLWTYPFSDAVNAPLPYSADEGNYGSALRGSYNTAAHRAGPSPPAQKALSPNGWNRYIVVQCGDQQRIVDRELIDPFLNIISHGGHHDVGSEKRVIMVFAACYFPRRSIEKYEIIMQQLFYYLCHTISLCVSNTYEIVYFNGGTDKQQTPSKSWTKDYYEMAEYRLKKNLRKIYFVHPNLRLKTLVRLSKVFLSSKSSKKIVFVKSVAELKKHLPVEYIFVPDDVRRVDGTM